VNKTQWTAVGGVVALAAIVLVLVLRNPQPAAIPGNADHNWHGADGCLVCHGLNGRSPRTPNHPVGRDCLRCHAVAP
jgi:hypothetical protein